MKKIIAILVFFCANYALAQVKVGDNINTIDAASILELESTTKAFVTTRVNTIQMNAITPLNGALIYNTDEQCVFVYEGTRWKSLCNSTSMVFSQATPPDTQTEGDIWFNEATGVTSIWDGANWLPIIKNPTKGDGAPTADAFAGDIYVDNLTGDLYTHDGTTWVKQTVTVANGIRKLPNNTIALGGALTEPTTITTDSTNTLAINGLEEDTTANKEIVTVEAGTGVLRKSSISTLVQQEEIVIIATDNQNQFSPPQAITSSGKINVYRNGVRLGFTVIDDTTIELESPVVCYQNDEIRIVQIF